MLRCPKCETENLPGRLFCGGCGGKLNMAAIAGDARLRDVRRVWARRALRLVVMGALLWLVASVALALWSRQDRIGAEGTRLGGRRVERQLKSPAVLGSGQSASAWLTEADVNGYLDHFVRPDLGVESISAAFHPGYAVLRIVRVYGPYRLGPFTIAPHGSVEVSYVPIGRVLSPRKVVLGRLSLPGPLRSAVARRVMQLLAVPAGEMSLDTLSGMSIAAQKIELTFKK